MSEWTILGERLSYIMREYDVSLRELSRRTGITLTTLHRYATCKRVPRATEILKCANALGITCDYLLGLSDDPHLTGKGERIKANKMNNDLISRQAALEKVRAMQTYKLFVGDDMILVDKAEVQTELMMLPSVHPEPQEGEWIPVQRCEGDTQPDLECPFCKHRIGWFDMGRYCAGCGAKLKGGA